MHKDWCSCLHMKHMNYYTFSWESLAEGKMGFLSSLLSLCMQYVQLRFFFKCTPYFVGFSLFLFPPHFFLYVIPEVDVRFCKLGVSCNSKKGWAKCIGMTHDRIKKYVYVFNLTLSLIYIGMCMSNDKIEDCGLFIYFIFFLCTNRAKKRRGVNS